MQKTAHSYSQRIQSVFERTGATEGNYLYWVLAKRGKQNFMRSTLPLITSEDEIVATSSTTNTEFVAKISVAVKPIPGENVCTAI